jgi:putative flippase GtrA
MAIVWLPADFRERFVELVAFAASGAVTFVVDMAIYNRLTGQPARMGRVPASIAATTVAMTASFLLNALWVFHPATVSVAERWWRFALIAVTAAWLVQSLVIGVASRCCTLTGHRLGRRLAVIGGRRFPAEWWERNTVKVAAVLAAMLWNYCGYRFWVFA